MKRWFLRRNKTTTVLTHEHVLGESNADRARKLRRAAGLQQPPQTTATSLIPETLEQMSREERVQHRRTLPPTPSNIQFPHHLHKREMAILQVNIGLYCNQACAHCHVESSPRRKNNQMSKSIIDQCLAVLANSPEITCLDITGGAPELHEHFRYFVERARDIRGFGKFDIIDRCNLTVLSEPNQDDLARFLQTNKVHVVASLPCYGEKNVDMQRGNGVFARSIRALQQLNDVGYGTEELQLDLVYNPLGGFLPPDQRALELQYKKKLDEDFGITFNRLFCLTNMPIKRFADFLHRRGELTQYMELLVSNYNAETLESIMCKNTVSVRYDGALFDCDFNQQLGLFPLKPKTIFDIKSTGELFDEEIATESHCFGCTAGRGSSCQGEVL